MKDEFVKGLVEQKEARLKELKRDLGYKLAHLQISLTNTIATGHAKGYDFAQPNILLFTSILQLEAQIRELTNF